MSDFMTTGSDDLIDLDFTGVQAASFGAVPPGDYLGTITEAKKDISKEKQTPFLQVKIQLFGCVSDPMPLGAENCQGKIVTGTIWLGEKSKPFAKAFFDALMGQAQASGQVKFAPSQLVGMNIGVVLTKGTYMKKNDDGSSEERPNNQILGYFQAPNL